MLTKYSPELAVFSFNWPSDPTTSICFYEASSALKPQDIRCAPEDQLVKIDSEHRDFAVTDDRHQTGNLTNDAIITNTATTTFEDRDELVASAYSGENSFSYTYDKNEVKRHAVRLSIKKLLES
ncbi:MAG: hypothetical protein HQK56_03805 [Deltaproteobacteria bacterium]|nr:hypothetical protein [Deltaproteobacteria bacterium]